MTARLVRVGACFSIALLVLAACSSAQEPSSAASPAVDLTSGLIGHFPLDGDAADLTGSTPGEVIGTSAAADRHGQAGKALRVAEDNWVQFSDAGALNVTRNFSIAIWVQPADTGPDGIGPDWYTLFEKSDPERGGHSRYGLWLHGDRPAACFELEDNSRQVCVEASDSLPSDGDWHHVAAVRADRRLILYLDGAEVANGFVGLHRVSQTDFDAFIGADTYQPETPWLDASVDELRVYDRALTAAEVLALAEQ